MGHQRRFRFGVLLGGLAPGGDWAAVARGAENLGYSILVMPDHLNGQLSAIPALAAAAMATSELRVGTAVLANDLRHPLLVAHDMATIDVLSAGRAELGLGAGWLREDYDQLGVPFAAPGTRVLRLAEAATLIRGALSDPCFTFAGDHYSVALRPPGLTCVQDRLPIMMGGGGPATLRLAASMANIVSVNPDLRAGGIPPLERGVPQETIDRQLGWVKASAGPRYPDLEINVVLQVADVGGLQPHLPVTGGPAGTASTVMSPHVVGGRVSQVADQLERRRERWDMSYVCVPAAAMVAFAPVIARLAGR